MLVVYLSRIPKNFSFTFSSLQGIGFAIAKGLVDKGHFVFLGSRDVARGEAAAAALDAAKVQVIFYPTLSCYSQGVHSTSSCSCKR